MTKQIIPADQPIVVKFRKREIPGKIIAFVRNGAAEAIADGKKYVGFIKDGYLEVLIRV